MTRPGAEMPVPPPFMWACGRCGNFLEDMAVVLALVEEEGCYDGATHTELAFAEHIAQDHPEDVPPPHVDGCEMCAVYERWDDLPEMWAEHRARDLFLPEDVARLLWTRPADDVPAGVGGGPLLVRDEFGERDSAEAVVVGQVVRPGAAPDGQSWASCPFLAHLTCGFPTAPVLPASPCCGQCGP